MKNENTGRYAVIKEKISKFYQCELRTFKLILGIK